MANFIANMNHHKKLMMFIQGTSTFIDSEFILNYPHKKSKVCTGILSTFLILRRKNSLFFLLWKVYKSRLSRFVSSYDKVPAKVCQIILKVNNLQVLLTLVPGICADPTLSEA